MLTAFDAKSERILNLVEFDQKSRDEMHGIRVARSNGYDIVCRQCEHGVHLRTNHRGRWYWQHNALGRALGVVSDPKGERVVGRLFSSPYDDAVQLPPMPLGQFVNKVAKRRNPFLWTDVGDDRSWIAYPADSATTVIRRRGASGPATRDTPADDRLCARPTPTYPAMPDPHVEPERRPDFYEEPLSQPAFELVETKAQPATTQQQEQPARTTPGPDWHAFECPRCRRESKSEFYGPCASCVAQLRARFS